MAKGKVKDYDTNRGYGRIIDSSTGEALTVYANSIDSETGQALKEGQSVEYEIEYHRGENWAVYVRIVQV